MMQPPDHVGQAARAYVESGADVKTIEEPDPNLAIWATAGAYPRDAVGVDGIEPVSLCPALGIPVSSRRRTAPPTPMSAPDE